jgi:2-polyprenyl-3-methyl-5-hydroxy-6-metoxy-1,4-benzoquinol methylase
MENNEIIEKIESFPVWQYQFNLKGHLTPIRGQEKINRHFQRKKYFFDPLLEIAGGSLAGKRVLDLGCNAGFWSFLAAENECEYVLGIDGRQMHIDQANFVFEANEIENNRYGFIKGNVLEIDFKKYGTFDIVLFLGLLYHINKPVCLMEKITEINSDILIIDTRVSKAKGSFLEILHESIDDPRHAVDYQLVFRPTKKAVFDIVRQFGYNAIMLKPQFNDYTGANVYRKGTRKAFLCAKQSDLSILTSRMESIRSK